MRYKTPKSNYFRLHHIRPRFKNNVENVLIFMATEISEIDECLKDEFALRVNFAVKRFPGNITKKQKTINNWRTEISSLFGLIQSTDGKSLPGQRAKELADHQDLIRFFKLFLYFFQYPGGHLKPHENQKVIEKKINFQPAKHILKLLSYAEKCEGVRASINKAELTHCVFNDLRVTTGQERLEETWQRIKTNRNSHATYDWTGDVIRYAGDILDYMVLGNLLTSHGSDFYLNSVENESIEKFIKSDDWFDKYDKYIEAGSAELEDINNLQDAWFDFVNQTVSDDFFKTDLFAVISSDVNEYKGLHEHIDTFLQTVEEEGEVRTKDIGDLGENIAFGHECMRLKISKHEDLIHLVKHIPNSFALGYDIKSVEEDATDRYIEVKTTISMSEINFNKFHLTSREWKAAESATDRYFVYRLILNKKSRKLFILPDPVGQYVAKKLDMTPKGDGADIVFSPTKCGKYEPILEWKS